MKRFALIVCLMGTLVFSFGIVPSHAAEVDVLVNKLVEKGLFTREEATQLLKQMQKEDVRQETKIKETAEKAAKETVQKEAKTAGWAEVPKWVSRIHFKGDFRLRYQYQNIDLDNGTGTDPSRNRGRYRWRFGAVADVTKDKKWQVGFGLASGSGDPRSTNQTFVNDFETPDARIDYAYAQWQPVKWLKAIGGQMKNPIFKVKDLMWDSDIRPQGVAVPINYAWSDSGTFFLNPALFVLDEYKDPDAGDPIMFVFQPGVKMKINKMLSFAVSGSYYWNSDVKGSSFKYSSGTNTTDANGALIYNYSALSLNAKFDAKFGGPVPGAGVFGTYVNSDADDNDTGWLAGIWFGHKDYNKELWKWRIKYNYRHLERDAWPDFLPDSDFYDGETNAKGHEFEVCLGLAKNVWFAFDYYHAMMIDYAPGSTDEPQNVVQCDFNFKF